MRPPQAADGPLKTELERIVGRQDAGPGVTFCGRTNEVKGIMDRTKTFVLTSRSEALSIAMAEAMAAGAIPVVADVGELADFVEDGKNGFLVPPNRIDVYADRVQSILEDEALRSRLSRAASESARRYYGTQVVAERWKQHLGRVIAAHFSGCLPKTTASEAH